MLLASSDGFLMIPFWLPVGGLGIKMFAVISLSVVKKFLVVTRIAHSIGLLEQFMGCF